MPPAPVSAAQVVATVALYLALNLGLNFFNKWAFTPKPDGLGFSFPIFQSAADQIITFVLLSGLMRVRPRLWTISWTQFCRFRLQLIAVAVLSQGTIICNNASLVLIGLSLNQMIKCLIPLPTVFFAYFVERQTPTAAVLASLLILCAGAVMAVPFGDPSFSLAGILLASSAMLMAAFRATLTALLMNDADANGLTPIALVWYTAAVSVVVLPPMFLLSQERDEVVSYFGTSPALGMGILWTISLAAAAYNVLVFEVTRITSSVSFTAINCVKLVMLINLTAVFIDHVHRLLNWCGAALFSSSTFYVGLLAYSYLKCRAGGDAAAQQQQQQQQAAARADGERIEGERQPLKEPQPSVGRTATTV